MIFQNIWVGDPSGFENSNFEFIAFLSKSFLKIFLWGPTLCTPTISPNHTEVFIFVSKVLPALWPNFAKKNFAKKKNFADWWDNQTHMFSFNRFEPLKYQTSFFLTILTNFCNKFFESSIRSSPKLQNKLENVFISRTKLFIFCAQIVLSANKQNLKTTNAPRDFFYLQGQRRN